MPLSADRCKETTTTTGTGNITLAGAVAQHQAFITAFPAGQTNIQYAIVGQTGTEWEVGEGTLVNSTTFSRDAVRASSNSNALVSFSAGTKDIFATATAERITGILPPRIAPALVGSFSWFNQGAATVAQTDSLIYLEGPAVSGVNLRGQVKNVPGSTPYSVVMGAMCNFARVDSEQFGFMITDGTKVVGLGPQYNTGGGSNLSEPFSLNCYKYTNATTFSASYAALRCHPRDRWWFKYRDDGTNRTFSFSADGVNFMPLASHSRTDFLTATQWGFYVDPENTTWKVGVSLFSWLEGG